jgi:hypothetical protein
MRGHSCIYFNVCMTCVIDKLYKAYAEMRRIQKCFETTLKHLSNGIRGCVSDVQAGTK